MFFDARATIESDHHRQSLLDEAAAHRLAKQARAARRNAAADPPPARPAAPAKAETHSERNSEADRRYAVSR
ncbi:hypothetical protein WEH80_12815 [Actinomycetes bacterium KLBMP 9759]